MWIVAVQKISSIERWLKDVILDLAFKEKI